MEGHPNSMGYRDLNTGGTERLPIPILVLSTLFAFYIVVLHVLIFFNGVCPLFGVWVNELRGIVLLDISILCSVGLAWGALRLKKWAWWGALLYFSASQVRHLASFTHRCRHHL